MQQNLKNKIVPIILPGSKAAFPEQDRTNRHTTNNHFSNDKSENLDKDN